MYPRNERVASTFTIAININLHGVWKLYQEIEAETGKLYKMARYYGKTSRERSEERYRDDMAMATEYPDHAEDLGDPYGEEE